MGPTIPQGRSIRSTYCSYRNGVLRYSPSEWRRGYVIIRTPISHIFHGIHLFQTFWNLLIVNIDEELDLETNLSAIRLIRKTMLKSSAATDVPLSVDSQDGYGDSLASYIRSIIRLGVVGINLEDVARSTSNTSENIVETLISPEKAAVRVRTVLEVAKEMGVDGFVVNARTDCVKLGGTIEEAIHRGKLFLEAGATTVFVWGGPARGLRDAEIRELVDSLGGKVAVIHKRVDGYLGVKEIANLGVARISMGPGLVSSPPYSLG